MRSRRNVLIQASYFLITFIDTNMVAEHLYGVFKWVCLHSMLRKFSSKRSTFNRISVSKYYFRKMPHDSEVAIDFCIDCVEDLSRAVGFDGFIEAPGLHNPFKL